MVIEKKKFGFDIHGVLDDLPGTFVALNNALYNAGHEIHIITGITASTEVLRELQDAGIKWHRFFSIVDYHKSVGTKIEYDEKTGLPWLDKEMWNRTKADYCEREGIDLHFDDTGAYEPHFRTPFARVWTKNNRNGRGTKPTKTAVLDLRDTILEAPFTDEQVKNINEYQKHPSFHPFTCCSHDGCTRNETNNNGLLVATNTGMECSCGKWKQKWVHKFMAENNE